MGFFLFQFASYLRESFDNLSGKKIKDTNDFEWQKCFRVYVQDETGKECFFYSFEKRVCVCEVRFYVWRLLLFFVGVRSNSLNRNVLVSLNKRMKLFFFLFKKTQQRKKIAQRGRVRHSNSKWTYRRQWQWRRKRRYWSRWALETSCTRT